MINTTLRSKKKRELLNRKRRQRTARRVIRHETYCRQCGAELLADEINCCEDCFRKSEVDFYLQYVL